jgi:hypothetical protein
MHRAGTFVLGAVVRYFHVSYCVLLVQPILFKLIEIKLIHCKGHNIIFLNYRILHWWHVLA